jgi:hypothetical protein
LVHGAAQVLGAVEELRRLWRWRTCHIVKEPYPGLAPKLKPWVILDKRFAPPAESLRKGLLMEMIEAYILL